jgi:FkbH-like protein
MPDISFVKLAKNCKKDNFGMPQYRLAILGDCATQHLSAALKGYGYEAGIGLEVFDAGFNQIFTQIADANSELYRFNPQGVLFFNCVEKLYETYCETPVEERAVFAQTVYEQIENHWLMLERQSGAVVLQFNFAEMDDRIFGSYANKADVSFLFQQRKLNYLLMEGCRSYTNTFLVDINSLQSRCGRKAFFDAKLYYIAKMPVSIATLPAVAKQVVDVIKALNGQALKCIVLDLDNTLWGGIIGEDGIGGIEIGELGAGHVFSQFQMWLKELRRRGIILAVCSKNDEETAKEPFVKHSEMVLRLDDIAVFIANWEDKAGNIRRIQQTLNIGMDSMVFLDDSPFERKLVQGLIPEILVPELPEDPARYLEFLISLNLFEAVSYTQSDMDRTGQYRAEAERLALRRQYTSYAEYLAQLDMRAEAKPFDLFHLPRIAQLTQRSNQFNLRTVRYTQAEIQALTENERYLTIYFTLRDKFADHGLVSAVIMEKQSSDTLFVNTWLMSCRVLKRGMEEYVANKMLETARWNGYAKVIGEYIQTPKNAMVKDIYQKMGFRPHKNNQFIAEVDSFVSNQTLIASTRKEGYQDEPQ